MPKHLDDAPEHAFRKRRRRRRFRITRDAVIFAVGLVGILHESFISRAERPTLLLLFAAMIGLPAFLHADEKKEGE